MYDIDINVRAFDRIERAALGLLVQRRIPEQAEER